MPPALPFFPALFRLGRLAAMMAAGLLGLYALACAYVNWSGPRQWAQVKAMLEKEGETLDFARLLPPPVDPAANFFAIEPLDGIAAQDKESPKCQALEALNWNEDGEAAPLMTTNMDGNGLSVDFGAWAAFARENSFVQMPADSGNPARDLLEAIDRSKPLARQLADAATAHEATLFTPEWKERLKSGSPMLLKMPHSSALLRAQKTLFLRALAANECADSAAAAASTLALLRFSEGWMHEPLMIDTLLANTTLKQALEAVWVILEKQRAGEEQLWSLQHSLERLDLQRLLLAALRGELAAFANFSEADAAVLEPEALEQMTLLNNGIGVLKSFPRLAALYWKLMPEGIGDYEKAMMASLEYEHLIKPLKAGNLGGMVRQMGLLQGEILRADSIWRPGSHSTAKSLPSLMAVIQRACFMEALRRQAVIACALERFYLKTRVWPEQLSALVPEYLTALPADPMDGQPMRYKRDDKVRYKIWSVAFNGKDDHGRSRPDTHLAPNPARPTSLDYQWDWVWQYLPVEK